MKANLAVLSIIAIGYFTLSHTVIIHAELNRAKTEIIMTQDNLLDAKIKIKIQQSELNRQDKVLEWIQNNVK